jgi:hypothetical protein
MDLAALKHQQQEKEKDIEIFNTGLEFLDN